MVVQIDSKKQLMHDFKVQECRTPALNMLVG